MLYWKTFTIDQWYGLEEDEWESLQITVPVSVLVYNDVTLIRGSEIDTIIVKSLETDVELVKGLINGG